MAIKSYLTEQLIPALLQHGMTNNQAEFVADDVLIRIQSVLSRWNDIGFRRTLLVIGREEAVSYQPLDADLEIRSLVVVTVRNSALEDISSTRQAAKAYGLAGPINLDAHMRRMTGAAITHFTQVDLPAEAGRVSPPPADVDPFLALPTKYPAAWAALEQLSNPTVTRRSYDPVQTRPSLADSGTLFPEVLMPKAFGETMSGMDPSIGTELAKVLREVAAGALAELFVPSFKHLSRNPDKLLSVIEFVFHHNIPIVTPNYYLSNGHVVQRTPLLRPVHYNRDLTATLAAALRNARGVHRQALMKLRESGAAS